jgi:hypothetical protein
MKIYERILEGVLEGYTIRKSKQGWYDLYSKEGISQTNGKFTYEEIKVIINEMEDYETTTRRGKKVGR